MKYCVQVTSYTANLYELQLVQTACIAKYISLKNYCRIKLLVQLFYMKHYGIKVTLKSAKAEVFGLLYVDRRDII